MIPRAYPLLIYVHEDNVPSFFNRSAVYNYNKTTFEIKPHTAYVLLKWVPTNSHGNTGFSAVTFDE